MADGGARNGTEEEFLPYDLLTKILVRVPVKSLTRFKCMTKDWMKLLESPHFITQQLFHSTSNNASLFFRRIIHSHPPTSSCSLIGPDFKVHSIPSIASSSVRIVGSCNGLLLIKPSNNRTNLFVWNPATRQVKQVSGTLIDQINFQCIGFGFSQIVNDYKIVRISHLELDHEYHQVVDRAEVYSLTSGSWKEINVTNLQDLYVLSSFGVTTNGAIFWKATPSTGDSNYDSKFDLVVSFDIEREVFTLLKGPPPPPSSATCLYNHITMVFDNKLAMFREFFEEDSVSYCIDLWVLEEANTGEAMKSWVKKYTVGPFSRILRPLCIWNDEIVYHQRCFRKNDGSIRFTDAVSLFNPYSNQWKHLQAFGDGLYYDVINYAESLIPINNIHHN